MNKIIEWLKESNRYKHLMYGAISTIIVFIVVLVILPLIPSNVITAGIMSFFIISAVAVGMEFKDKLYGNKFDITDIVCTVILSIILLLITIIGNIL